ncbi:hypothetical protein HDU97_001893 [Phlyctochytrium planicorne]|nr:hypothetical protein HDU97_001893 [Phlyctochytrium planicorne]
MVELSLSPSSDGPRSLDALQHVRILKTRLLASIIFDVYSETLEGLYELPSLQILELSVDETVPMELIQELPAHIQMLIVHTFEDVQVVEGIEADGVYDIGKMIGRKMIVGVRPETSVFDRWSGEEEEEGETMLLQLPEELLAIIVSNLPKSDGLKLIQTCKTFGHNPTLVGTLYRHLNWMRSPNNLPSPEALAKYGRFIVAIVFNFTNPELRSIYFSTPTTIYSKFINLERLFVGMTHSLEDDPPSELDNIATLSFLQSFFFHLPHHEKIRVLCARNLTTVFLDELLFRTKQVQMLEIPSLDTQDDGPSDLTHLHTVKTLALTYTLELDVDLISNLRRLPNLSCLEISLYWPFDLGLLNRLPESIKILFFMGLFERDSEDRLDDSIALPLQMQMQATRK